VLEDFEQQSPRTTGSNANRKDNSLESKGNKQQNKATLLLHYECTVARTTVLYHFANAVYGLGAWGWATRATNSYQGQVATMPIERTAPLNQKATSNGTKQPCSSTKNYSGKNYCLLPFCQCCVWIRCLRTLSNLGNQQSPRTSGNNANRKDNSLEPKGNKQWNKVTLLLCNKCAVARNTVLYHFANAVHGLGAWGLWATQPNNSHQRQLATSPP